MDVELILNLLALAWFGIGFVILYGMWMAGSKYFIPFILLKMIGLSFLYCLYLYFSKEALQEDYIYVRPLRNYIFSYAIISMAILTIYGFTKI